MIKRLNMIVGPPADKSRDKEAVELFKKDADMYVACGGITSRIVSLHLEKELELEAEYLYDGLMSYGHIDDVIVTEGVVTLCAVAAYLDGTGKIPSRGSGSRKILELVKQADLITIIFGTSVNEEHEGNIAFKYKEESLYTIKHELEKRGKKIRIIKF